MFIPKKEPLWNGTKFEDHEVHPHVIYKKDTNV